MFTREFIPPESMYTVHLTWFAQPNNPTFLAFHPYPKPARVSMNIAIHPNNSGRIVVNYPGFNERMNGENDRYKILSSKIQNEDLGAVARTSNPWRGRFLDDVNLRKMLDYTREHTLEICGSSQPEIFMMGFSSGASAVAATVASYPEVSRILLIAPSGDMPREMVEASLKKYTGEVYIMVGEEDKVGRLRGAEIYYELASSASKRQLITVPNGDHQFRGPVNNTIFNDAPFYAFGNQLKPSLLSLCA